MFKKSLLLVVLSVFAFSCAKKNDDAAAAGEDLNNNQVYKMGKELFAEESNQIRNADSIIGLWTNNEEVVDGDVKLEIRVKITPKRVIVAAKCIYTENGNQASLYASAVSTEVTLDEEGKKLTVAERVVGEVANSQRKCQATISGGEVEYEIDSQTKLLCMKNSTVNQTACQTLRKLKD